MGRAEALAEAIVVTAGGVCVMVDGALAALLLVAGLLGHGRSLAVAL
jgi:hypothetical protein